MGLVTLPHFLYLFAYHFGKTLNAWIPHDEFITLSILLRTLSIIVTIYLFKETFFQTWEFYDWLSPFPLVLAGLLFGIFGLQLNIAVYEKLGASGVYYSCEMIGDCKTAYGYPFETFFHPMYLGSMMILVGAMLLLGADADYQPRYMIITPLIYMIGLYIITMFSESTPRSQKMNGVSI
jgi:protein-S-isoprenylcysteine O-methyltransferase Ste14